MPVIIYDRRTRERRESDRRLDNVKAMYFACLILMLMAGLFLGMQIERRAEQARQTAITEINK